MKIKSFFRKLYFRTVDFFLTPYLFNSINAIFRKPANDFFWHAFRAQYFNHIDGDYAEFGVYRGRTWSSAFRAARGVGYRCHFWAFDSFSGLPEMELGTVEHQRWRPGALNNSRENFEALCARIGLSEHMYTVVPGFYKDTLGTILPEDPPQNISLAYIDCDMYISTREVLNFLKHRLKHGMIVALDDYFVWAKDQISGNRRAFLEILAPIERWHFEPFARINWHGMAFVVEDRAYLP